MKPSRPFIDGQGDMSTWYKAEHMRSIIYQIKMMLDSDTPYTVYACVGEPKQLTILSRVIALLNEKHLSKEITMTVKTERDSYFIEVHPLHSDTC